MASKRRLLVCEANEARGRSLVEFLAGAGHDVQLETDGAVAWATLQSVPPEILLVDSELPGLNGLELLALVSASGLNTPVVFMTDAGTENTAAEALNLGAACYLVRSSAKTFHATVEGALHRVGYQVDLEAQNRALLARLKEQNDNLERIVARRTIQLAAALDELRALDARKSEFLKLVSHEMRTPLTAIIGFCEVIQQGLYEDQAEMMELQSHIHLAGQRLMSFVNDALELFAWYGGRTLAEELAVRGTALADTALNAVGGKAAAKGVRLRNLIEGDWQVRGDPTLLHSALVRVLDNAVKYSARGGDVVVSAETSDGFATVTVRDHGCGIAPEKLPRLGRPLEIAGDIDHHSEGQGLGLAIVREILRAHGGALALRSEGSGKGTSVEIRLPCLPRATQQEVVRNHA
ncbi:MAG: hybrid sensor histidine kinase/response regulator [Planctomycetes bacterium]|nr:hybrid sensor histidine kinase/response regulator [Planctomycetota bacterium]